MTLPKKPQPPSKTPGDEKPGTSPKPSIDDQFEAMEEGRMDKILETLESHSVEPTDSTPS